MTELTDRQSEMLEFIKGYTNKHGYPPTVREICQSMRISSPNGILEHTKALVKKGYLKQTPKGTARGFVVVGNNALEEARSIIKTILPFLVESHIAERCRQWLAKHGTKENTNGSPPEIRRGKEVGTHAETVTKATSSPKQEYQDII